MFPRRRLGGADSNAVVRDLMAFHVWTLARGADPMGLLVAEGLLNALMAEPQTIVGEDLIEFVDGITASLHEA